MATETSLAAIDRSDSVELTSDATILEACAASCVHQILRPILTAGSDSASASARASAVSQSFEQHSVPLALEQDPEPSLASHSINPADTNFRAGQVCLTLRSARSNAQAAQAMNMKHEQGTPEEQVERLMDMVDEWVEIYCVEYFDFARVEPSSRFREIDEEIRGELQVLQQMFQPGHLMQDTVPDAKTDLIRADLADIEIALAEVEKWIACNWLADCKADHCNLLIRKALTGELLCRVKMQSSEALRELHGVISSSFEECQPFRMLHGEVPLKKASQTLREYGIINGSIIDVIFVSAS